MASSNPLIWLITGTSSGFGRRLALSALARGDKVIASARSLDKIQAIRTNSRVEDVDDKLRFLQLDVTSGEEVIKQKVDEASSFWGHIDVLVNNAGFGLPGLLEEGGSARLRSQFDTNVFGLMDVTAAALPYMRKQRSGTIVNIGSRSAWKTDIVGIGPYAASKAAVHAISETLAVEVAQFNIRVMLVAPGAFKTEGIYGQEYLFSNPIPDYTPTREESKKRFASVPGTEKGDPDKAMEALVDIVRGEGIAKENGRAEGEWPSLLVLGEDAERDLRSKSAGVIGELDKWVDVTRNVSFHERGEDFAEFASKIDIRPELKMFHRGAILPRSVKLGRVYRVPCSTRGMSNFKLTEAIKGDHQEMYEYYDQYKKAVGNSDAQARWARQLTWEVARHAVGEEIVVYPLMEKHLGEEGMKLANQDREEHLIVKQLLYKLEDLTSGTPAYDQCISEVMTHLHEHNDSEEQKDLPKLEPKLGNEGSEAAATSFTRTKQFVPTRAHPGAPDRPPFETLVGLMSAPIDKLKDVFAKFPTQEMKDAAK